MLTALVIAEAVAILLLGLLVAGLLRSHAEILRRLHELGAGLDEAPQRPADFAVQPGVAPPGESVDAAADVAGVSPDDEAVAVAVTGVGHRTLLAFLASGCTSCAEFWRAFADPALALPPATRLVVVTRDPQDESLSSIRAQAPDDVAVVMSSQAWDDYQVPGSPYFTLVDGPSGTVVGQGSAGSWPQVASLLGQALADAGTGSAVAGRRARRRGVDRDNAGRIDRELAAAGIHPGHPSLHPEAAADPTQRLRR